MQERQDDGKEILYTLNFSKMCVIHTVLLLGCVLTVSMSPLVMCHNAFFYPTNPTFQLSNLSPIMSQSACICRCYDDSSCITGTFDGNNQSCVLFSVNLQQGRLKLTNTLTSVFSFKNRSSINCESSVPTFFSLKDNSILSASIVTL